MKSLVRALAGGASALALLASGAALFPTAAHASDRNGPTVTAFNAPLVADVTGGYAANGYPNFCYLEFPPGELTVTGIKGSPKDQYYIEVNPGVAISANFTRAADSVPQVMFELPAPVFVNPQVSSQPVVFTADVWDIAPDGTQTLVTSATAENTDGCV